MQRLPGLDSREPVCFDQRNPQAGRRTTQGKGATARPGADHYSGELLPMRHPQTYRFKRWNALLLNRQKATVLAN